MIGAYLWEVGDSDMDWKMSKVYTDGIRVLHTSENAITVRDNDRVFKFYRGADEEAIQKESRLLRQFSGIESDVCYDAEAGCWRSSMPYIPLRPVFEVLHPLQVFWNITSVLVKWRSVASASDVVPRQWETKICPHMIADLDQWHPSIPDDAISFLRGTKSECFIHGGFTLSNMGYDSRGKLVILDYKNAGYGPFLWDETTFVYSLLEHGCIREARFAFLFFRCSYEMLSCIAAVQLSLAYKRNDHVQRREKVQRDIDVFFSDHAGNTDAPM